MIDQKEIRRLKPEERVTRLRELAEERRRELQAIDQMIKETSIELRQRASMADEEALLGRQLAEAEAIREMDTIDRRLGSGPEEQPESKQPALTEVAEMMAGMYKPAGAGFENPMEYSTLKQPGYENPWKQQEDQKFKRHEDRKEGRNPLLL